MFINNEDIFAALELAKVPKELYESCLNTLDEARKGSKGLFKHKLKARLYMAPKLAKHLRPEDYLLSDNPKTKDYEEKYGFAPNYGINLLGDNNPWGIVYVKDNGEEYIVPGMMHWRVPESLKEQVQRIEAINAEDAIRQGGTPKYSRPCKEPEYVYGKNTDPESLDYKVAVSRNYWLPNHHPNELVSKKAWLKRNSGERESWNRGKALTKEQIQNHTQVWEVYTKDRWVRVLHCEGVWQLRYNFKWMGLKLACSLGYEIDNIRNRTTGECTAWPREGLPIKAPVTWGITKDKRPGG